LAPLYRSNNRIEDSYIVVFHDNVTLDMLTADFRQISSVHNVAFQYTYQNTIKGFAAVLTAEQLTTLRLHPRVQFIEEDQMAHLTSALLLPVVTIGVFPESLQGKSTSMVSTPGLQPLVMVSPHTSSILASCSLTLTSVEEPLGDTLPILPGRTEMVTDTELTLRLPLLETCTELHTTLNWLPSRS
jgi:hypothetical protein